MPTVDDCLEHAKWLVEHGRGGEAAKLVLPKLEAQKRRANREKRTRVQFDCTPELYSRFHEQLTRFRELIGNPTIAQDLIVDVLQAVPDSTVLQLYEAGKVDD